MTLRFGACALFLLLAFACSDKPTQMVVQIDAPPALRMGENAIDNVRLDIFAIEGDAYVFRATLGAAVTDWPMRHVLTPEGGDASRSYLVQATGRRGLTVVSQASVASTYLNNKTGYVNIYLPAGECVGSTCELGETCVLRGNFASCAPVEPVEPSPDPTLDAGTDTPDGSDGGGCPNDGMPCTPEVTGECIAGGTYSCTGEGFEVCVPNYRAGMVCGREGTCNPSVCVDGVAGCVDGPETMDGKPSSECGEGELCFGGSCSLCIQGAVCTTNGGCSVGTWQCPTMAGETATCNVNPMMQLEDGTSCPEQGPLQGLCDAPDVCMNGSCIPRVADSEVLCFSANHDCAADQFCTGETVDCPDGQAPDGVFCGPEPTSCMRRSECMSGMCQPAMPQPSGTACGSDGMCDGQGDCITGCPLAENQCQINVLVDGVCTLQNREGGSCRREGQLCSLGECDAQGVCLPVSGERCETDETRGDPCLRGMCNDSGECVAEPAPDDTSCVSSSASCSPRRCKDGSCVPDTRETCNIVEEGQNSACIGSGMCNTDGGCEVTYRDSRCSEECIRPGTGTCENGFCRGTPIPQGQPCSSGNAICNGESACDPGATPVFSRIWVDGGGTHFEVYNPTDQSQTAEVMISVRNGTERSEALNVLAHGFQVVSWSYVEQINQVALLISGTQVVDSLEFARANGDRIPLPIERKACASSTVESMSPSGPHASAGNGYNPPGVNDYGGDFGAWLYLGENTTLGPSGTSSSYTEVPSCSRQRPSQNRR